MNDEAMHPTAGYLFADELDIYVLALDDFHSMLLQDDFTVSKGNGCGSPSSPSSVVYLPPCSPPLDGFEDFPVIKQEPYVEVFIKPEPSPTANYPNGYPQPTTTEEDKERLRRRQRGYEKRYRGRKRRDLKMQRDAWLALELKLDATRKKYCRPYLRTDQGGRDSVRYKLLQLKLEERALRQDQVAMRSLESWEQISRIREYSDKEELRTVSEWRHSADKVIGRCSSLGPNQFHPYAPLQQRHFTW